MIFVDNSNLIQSEARLRPCRSSACGSKASTKESKKKDARKPDSETAEFPQLELDHGVLPMDYHKQIVAGVLSSKHIAQSPLASLSNTSHICIAQSKASQGNEMLSFKPVSLKMLHWPGDRMMLCHSWS